MPKTEEFSTEEFTDDKKKKKKAAVIFGWSRCRQPHCGDKLTFTEDQDPDLEIAKHNKTKHDIAYPGWVDIIWDKYHPKPKFKKYDNEKKSYKKD